jgi:hypothetical protein
MLRKDHRLPASSRFNTPRVIFKKVRGSHDLYKVMRQPLADQGVQKDCVRLQRQLDETNPNPNLVTRVSVITVGGIKTTLVDAGSFVNVIPDFLLHSLGLTSRVANEVTLNMGGRLVPSNQYCKLKIRLAGTEMTIDTVVIPGHDSYIRLGRAWAMDRSCDFHSCVCYIKGNLIKLPTIDGQSQAQLGGSDDGTFRGDGNDNMDEVGMDKGKNEKEVDANEIANEIRTNEVADEGRIYGTKKYVIDRILAERTQYLIQWEGFEEKESTWEPQREIPPVCIGEWEQLGPLNFGHNLQKIMLRRFHILLILQ